jgi:hypothetical protein
MPQRRRRVRNSNSIRKNKGPSEQSDGPFCCSPDGVERELIRGDAGSLLHALGHDANLVDASSLGRVE